MRLISINSIMAASVITALIFACNGSDVTGPPDANDFDAIYHIIVQDRTSEFNLDLLDLTIPDTLLPLPSQVLIEHYWFTVTYDSLDLPINIDYPNSQDSLGSLPEAIARWIKLFYGTMEIMGVDTSGGGQIPFRLTKSLFIRAEIISKFVKYGGDTNFRRGWLLTEISDVAYTASYPGGITQIRVSSDSYPDLVLSTGRKPLGNIPEFAPGESLTVNIFGSNLNDVFRVRIPGSNGYQNIVVEPDNGSLQTGFRVPSGPGFYHFLVEAIGESCFIVNGPFRYEGQGVLFEVR